ncbi:MAG: hypothetical protein NVS3B10_24630 [Polyangiales bacterium]
MVHRIFIPGGMFIPGMPGMLDALEEPDALEEGAGRGTRVIPHTGQCPGAGQVPWPIGHA